MSATFSPCRTYRYSLARHWDDTKPAVMFVGLNPSTADETVDDPTIRRCIAFARSWGFGALVMTNLFAYRATDPKVMTAADDPIGNPYNDITIETCARNVGGIIACWGAHGDQFIPRVADVERIIGTAYCLGLTKTGQPKHPLYLAKDTQPRRYCTAPTETTTSDRRVKS